MKQAIEELREYICDNICESHDITIINERNCKECKLEKMTDDMYRKYQDMEKDAGKQIAKKIKVTDRGKIRLYS